MKKTTLLASLLFYCPIFSQYTFVSPNHIFNTPNGNITLGTTNTNIGNISTTLSKFLFNKDIFLETGNISSNNSNLSLNTSGTNRITILNSNGNIGIGTQNPLSKLQVNGDIYLPSNYQLKFGAPSLNSGFLRIANSQSSFNTYADFYGNLYFRRTGVTGTSNLGAVLGLQSDGTVTIGVWEKYNNSITNTDGNKLMVNGGILCEKIKVILDVPNSDHVFNSNYQLRSLEEINQFIILNKHLPEIPSAEEFKKNGYNIGEMDDILLRKIEEITLYLIQLKKENEELMKKIELKNK